MANGLRRGAGSAAEGQPHGLAAADGGSAPLAPDGAEGLGTAAGARPAVLVAEFMDAGGLEALGRGARVSYRPELAGDRAGLLGAVAGHAGLVVRNRCRVDAALLEAAGPSLRVVGRLGAGLDNVDLSACAAAGVRVVFARGANADAVCEYVFAALLHLFRGLAEAAAAVRGGSWPREAYSGREMGGRTLGVVGLGEVGRRLATRAAAFHMRVVGCDPLVPPERLRGVPVDALDLDGVLAASDVVSLHLPLLPDTRHLIGARALRRMRRGAILVNAARGGIVDEEALAEAVRSGRLGGAALDVREQEPPPQPDALAGLPGVLLTPHIAGITAESQARVCAMVVADVLAVLAGREPAAAAV
jgi:(S)-sulfolactate dehydrogenase